MVKTLQAGLQNSNMMTQWIIEHLLLIMWNTDLPGNRIFGLHSCAQCTSIKSLPLLQTVEYDIACMTTYVEGCYFNCV